jgi:hypothetical protein
VDGLRVSACISRHPPLVNSLRLPSLSS